MQKSDKIYVAGHRGLMGSAIIRTLQKNGFSNIVTRTSSELDLREQLQVREFFQQEKPTYVFLAAAKVGGIHANNTYPADFIYENLAIQNNVIRESYLTGVEKLLFLGSSCIYPKLAPQPLLEEYLLTGALEPTNEAYAIAKIAGIKLCEYYKKQYNARFISGMPTNLYGQGDNYDLNNSHVLPALIRKFHEAKIDNADQVVVWGSGKPCREFLHADDAADACLFLMQNYEGDTIVNIGVGKDTTIAELAMLVKEITEFKGQLVFDQSKPDGTPKKLLNVDKLNSLGWHAAIGLKEGISRTYEDFKKNYSYYTTGKNKNILV